MNSRRSTLLLLDKIQRDWTAASLTPYLSPEVIDVVTEDLNRIEPGTKVRVLLSFLTLQNSQELSTSITQLLKACEEDGSEDWVGVIAPLVQRQLPDLVDQSSLDSSKGANKFEQALQRIRDKLLSTQPADAPTASLVSNGEKKPNESATFSLPASFLPLEFPYLSKSLLPKSLEISGDKNTHFTVREHDKTLRVKFGATDRPQRQPSAPRATAPKKREIRKFQVNSDMREKMALQRSGSSIKVVDFNEMEKARADKAAKEAERVKAERLRKMKETRQANKAKKQPDLTTPEGIKEALLNIVRDANKVTEHDKTVIEDYLRGGNNPDPKTTKVKVILLNESRKFSEDKSAVIVEQMKLKIDYESRTLKKVKGVKRFKLKAKS